MATPDTAQAVGETAHAGREPFPPFDSAKFGSQLLWLAIAFGLLYWLMAKHVLPRVGGVIHVRKDRIFHDMGEAQRLARESAAARQAYEKKLADARANAARMAQEARDAASRESDARTAEAEAGLGARIAESERRIAAIRDRAMADVGAIATDTAEAIVARLAGQPGGAAVATAVADVMKR